MEDEMIDVPASQEENEQGQPERSVRPQVTVTQDMLDKSSRTLGTMFDYLGLDASIRTETRPNKINLIVSSEDAGRIIGRKGQSLESLQLLLNRMMQKADVDFPKVYIDIDGYSSKQQRGGRDERRPRRSDDRGGQRRPRRARNDEDGDGAFDQHDEILRQQAIDAAKEVRRWGEPVTLPSMNAHDRRIVHITLESESDLATESKGDGSHKSVTVSLKKA